MMDSSIDTWPNELHAANFKIHHVVYRVSVFDCKLRSYSTRGLQRSLLRFRFELSRVYLPLRHTAKVYTPRNYFDWSQFGQHGGEHQTFQHSLKRPDNIVALKIKPLKEIIPLIFPSKFSKPRRLSAPGNRRLHSKNVFLTRKPGQEGFIWRGGPRSTQIFKSGGNYSTMLPCWSIKEGATLM